ILGAAAGGLMVRPTPAQIEALQSHNYMSTAGAHTVGAPDGGPGIPGVGWSTQYGDLRIPHFFGLHGVQLLPFIGWLTLRRRSSTGGRKQIPMAFAAAGSYLGFIGILTWQALRGQSLIDPDSTTLFALAVWLMMTILAAVLLTRDGVLHGS